MTDERAPSDAACIIPFASACTYEGAELQPPVSAIRRPFRVERDAVPDLSRSPRSNNIRRSVRVGFGLHDLRRREVAWQTKGDEIVQWKSQSVSGFDSKHAFDSAPGQIGQRPLVKTIKRYFGWTFGFRAAGRRDHRRLPRVRRRRFHSCIDVGRADHTVRLAELFA